MWSRLLATWRGYIWPLPEKHVIQGPFWGGSAGCCVFAMVELKKTVVMVGMMGAGKTAVGEALATRLGVPFLDSDAEIERAANRTIAEIFADNGEAFFRQKERQIVARLLRGPCCVLSVGGGAFLSPETRDAIAERGVSIWLRVPVPLLWRRVKANPSRPLLRTEDPRGTLERLAGEREADYRRADLIVDAEPGLGPPGMARVVEAALARQPGVLENCR